MAQHGDTFWHGSGKENKKKGEAGGSSKGTHQPTVAAPHSLAPLPLAGDGDGRRPRNSCEGRVKGVWPADWAHYVLFLFPDFNLSSSLFPLIFFFSCFPCCPFLLLNYFLLSETQSMAQNTLSCRKTNLYVQFSVCPRIGSGEKSPRSTTRTGATITALPYWTNTTFPSRNFR